MKSNVPSLTHNSQINSIPYKVNYFIANQQVLPSLRAFPTNITGKKLMELLDTNSFKYEVIKTDILKSGKNTRNVFLFISLFNNEVLLCIDHDEHNTAPEGAYYDDEFEKDNTSEEIDRIEIYYDYEKTEKYQNLFTFLEKLPQKKENKKSTINIVCSDPNLYLKEINVKKINLDININYNDDFIEISKDVIKNINQKDKDGIVLFHGEPGCGKTSYIKYLLTKLNKRIIYLPPNLVGELSSPSFISFLTDYPNSVLVIEDGENVIKTRKEGSTTAIANLLNLSNGLLSDVLKMQIIVTFNCALSEIDTALLRKGRLLCRYEFKKLNKKKAQELSNKIGFDTVIKEDMTIADIYNQDKPTFVEKKQTVGFR